MYKERKNSSMYAYFFKKSKNSEQNVLTSPDCNILKVTKPDNVVTER